LQRTIPLSPLAPRFGKPTIAAGELHVAVFTDAEQGMFTYNPQSPLRHSVKFLAEDFLFCSFLAKLGVLFSNLASMAKSFLNLLVHLSEGIQGLLVFHALILRRSHIRSRACGNQTAPLPQK
jgi:hypothetical protein